MIVLENIHVLSLSRVIGAISSAFVEVFLVLLGLDVGQKLP